jgi:phosphinothricin acetyltransferase
MLALIGDSGNAGSIALHRSLGFAEVGVLRQVGFKGGRWLDVVIMQRTLRTLSPADRAIRADPGGEARKIEPDSL